MCFDFLNRNRDCFDFLDLCFNFLNRNLVVPNVLNFSYRPRLTYVLTSLEICFKLFTEIVYVSTLSTFVSTFFSSYVAILSNKIVLDLSFEFLNQNRVCFVFFSIYVSTSSTAVLTFLTCVLNPICLGFCARPMFRLSQPKFCIFWLYQPMFRLPRPLLCFDFLDLCFDFLGQNPVCFVFCARPIFRISN